MDGFGREVCHEEDPCSQDWFGATDRAAALLRDLFPLLLTDVVANGVGESVSDAHAVPLGCPSSPTCLGSRMTALPPGIDTNVDAQLARPVSLHELDFLDEGDEVTVGRRDTDSYCVLPADGAALLRELAQGMPPAKAAEWYASTYGEAVDVAEFLDALRELGFLVEGDDAVSAGSNHVPWQRLGAVTFSAPAFLLYLALLLAAGVTMCLNPELAPRVRDLVFSEYTTAVILLGTLGQVPLILFHESFHALAGRRLGLRSRLRIGRRLYMLVAETTLDGLVMVPRRKRYLPILAGMLADLLSIATLTLAAAVLRHPDGTEPLPGRICLALSFATLLRFMWQFLLFLQTDLYHLTVTVLGCVDLQRTARRMLANRANRLLGRRHPLFDESRWHPRDRAAAAWYSWLLLAGYLLSIGLLVRVALPLLHILLGNVVGRLVTGHRVSWSELADSMISLVYVVSQLAVVAVMAIRERRRHRLSTALHVID